MTKVKKSNTSAIDVHTVMEHEKFSFDKAPEHRLREPFFMRPTELVALELLGCVLVRRLYGIMLAGRIVETEAYLHSDDAASHAANGRTPRNAAMFATGGCLYVYRSYGIHYCVNVVTEAQGRGCAVLIRALEPLAGIESMQRQRRTDEVKRLCNGPGNVAKALGFSIEDNMASVCHPELFILPALLGEGERIAVSARVGITKSAGLPLRFYLADNPFVSKGKPSA